MSIGMAARIAALETVQALAARALLDALVAAGVVTGEAVPAVMFATADGLRTAGDAAAAAAADAPPLAEALQLAFETAAAAMEASAVGPPP